MIQEEQQLLRRFGKPQPFKVPENYFQQFDVRLMQKLPQQTATSTIPAPQTARVGWVRRLRPLAVAASIAALVLLAPRLPAPRSPKETLPVSSKRASSLPAPLSSNYSSLSSDTNIDQAADYMMIDGDDFYAYLSAGSY